MWAYADEFKNKIMYYLSYKYIRRSIGNANRPAPCGAYGESHSGAPFNSPKIYSSAPKYIHRQCMNPVKLGDWWQKTSKT